MKTITSVGIVAITVAIGCAATAASKAAPGKHSTAITHGDWQHTDAGFHLNVCVARAVVEHPCVPCDVKSWGEVPEKCEAEWKKANGQ